MRKAFDIDYAACIVQKHSNAKLGEPMTTISTETSVHNVKRITAACHHTRGEPISLTLEGHNGLPSTVRIFLHDAEYASRLADAINGAATPPAEDHDEEFQAAVAASIAYFNRYAGDRS